MTTQQRNLILVGLVFVLCIGCCGCPCTIAVFAALTDDGRTRSNQPPWLRPDHPDDPLRPMPFGPDDQPCPPDGPCPRRPSPYGPYNPPPPDPYQPWNNPKP